MTNHTKPPNDRVILERILLLIEKHLLNRNQKSDFRIYDNKGIMQLLGIKDKYLKKLRDNGYLSYSREGDKYWYTQDDVERFLKRFHYKDFAQSRL